MPTSPATDRPPRDRGTPQRLRSDGFTLVELMLALAIIALVAALALPRARLSGGPAVLRSSAYQAAALLRADRASAVRLKRTVETVFDLSSQTLRSGATGDVLALPAAVPGRADGSSGGRFRFHPDGRSSGGALTLGAGAVRLDLRVDGFSSTVEILRPSDLGG